MALTFLADNFEIVTGLFNELSHEHRLQIADMFLSYAKAAAGDVDFPKLISQFKRHIALTATAEGTRTLHWIKI